MVEVLRGEVRDLARRVGDLEAELRQYRPAVLATKIEDIEDDVKAIMSEVRGLRRAVIGFAITVAGSAVAFALTVILVWGGGP